MSEAEEMDELLAGLRPWSREERERYLSSLGKHEHPLFMDGEPDPENPYIKALQNVMYDDPPEELARYFKNLGNETFKKGKLHHKMAMHYYTEGLTQAELAEQTEEMKQLASVCLSNRAAVLLAHKRYSQTLKDCEDALVRWSGNVKAYYRGAAAAAQLGSYEKGVGMAQQGLGLEPENRPLQALLSECEAGVAEQERRRRREEAERAAAAKQDKQFSMACARRGIRFCKPQVPGVAEHALTQSKPFVDADGGEDGLLHFPVAFLYEEHAEADFVQDVAEDELLRAHLQAAFPSGHCAPWDKESAYTLDRLEVFFQAVGDRGEELGRWCRVPLECSLGQVLRDRDYAVPGVPTFHVAARGTAFHAAFMAARPGLRTLTPVSVLPFRRRRK